MSDRRGARFFEGYRASALDLAVPRIIVASLVLLHLPYGMWLDLLPDAFVRSPLFLGALFSSFPSFGVLAAINIVAGLAGFMLLIGFKTPVASLVTSLSMIVLSAFCHMTGKIDHSILLFVTPLAMAGSGWGHALSVDGWLRYKAGTAPVAVDESRVNWSLTFFALLVALAMFTAALPKLTTGWLTTDSSAVYAHMFRNHFIGARRTFVSDWLVNVPDGLFWEAQDWLAVIIECAGLAVIVRQQWFTLWLVALMGFHLGVGLSFSIWFASNVAAYSTFMPWSWMLGPLKMGKPSRFPTGLLVFAAAILIAVCVKVGWLGVSDGRALEFVTHMSRITVLVAGVAFLFFLKGLLSSRER